MVQNQYHLNFLTNCYLIFHYTGIAGLAVTYALNLNSQLATIIWNICNTENKMISVERILQYSHIPSEAPLLIEDCRPPNKWPENGTIHIKNLEVNKKFWSYIFLYIVDYFYREIYVCRADEFALVFFLTLNKS